MPPQGGGEQRGGGGGAGGARDSDDEGQELDLDRDEPLIEKWRHLRKMRMNATGTNTSGEQAWWMVVAERAELRAGPSKEAELIATLERGDPIYGTQPSEYWLCVRPQKRPPSREALKPMPSWHTKLPGVPREAWIMWNGQEIGLGTLVMPVNHLDKLLQYRSTNIGLPREAVMWTLSEVDVYLGSVGFVRPGRESALMRCSKRLVRAVRGGAMGLEYRVDERGVSGGVFATGPVEKGNWVEVCPLLEVDTKLRMKSGMLTRITLRMVGGKERYGIVLGYGKVYTVSKTPNLRWSYRGDDEVVLWAAEEVHEGRELTVDFTAAPRPLQEAGRSPSSYRAPALRTSAGKLQNAGYVLHGNSGIHGRGVFITKDAAAGELIESCPALVLDEAGKEAMFSYRWGLKDDLQGDYFLPLGLGSLYNHSEKPTAKGTLDVRRRVLEFYATTDMYKGQEVLVSYGDTYFDEDYEGHRKSELLHIASPETQGNTELQKLIELQRALIRALASEEFLKELRERAGERQKNAMAGTSTVKKDQVGKTKSVHSLYMEVEQPILERFGYVFGMKGAFQMQEDLERASRGLDPTHEAVRNNAILGTLTHLYDPPPAEYWETAPLDLVIMGTEEDELPETLSVQVPKKVPMGFVRFMLSMRYPQTGTYESGAVSLVAGGGVDPYVRIKDREPLPPEGDEGRRILVSGIGDTWPASQRMKRPDGEEEEEFTDWQIIWRWLSHVGAQRLANNFKGGAYKIAGTWDNFKCTDMHFDGRCFVFWVTMTEQRWESFQILRDGCWETTLYPEVHDGSPWVRHRLRGPDNKGHGKNWTMGRHAEDTGEPGTLYKVELRPDDRGQPGSVHWTRFTDKEKGEHARKISNKEVDWAAAQKQSEENAEASRREEEANNFRLEWARRQVTKNAANAVAFSQWPASSPQAAQIPKETTGYETENNQSFDFDALEEATARLAAASAPV